MDKVRTSLNSFYMKKLRKDIVLLLLYDARSPWYTLLGEGTHINFTI